MSTVPQIVSRRPSSRLLLAGSWLITLVIVVPVLAGCGGSPAQGAPPTATASTTQVLITVPDVIGMKGDVAAETLKEAAHPEAELHGCRWRGVRDEGEQLVRDRSGSGSGRTGSGGSGDHSHGQS